MSGFNISLEMAGCVRDRKRFYERERAKEKKRD